MNSQERLIQISTPHSLGCQPTRMIRGPIADKFFVVGAVASIIGIGWIGTHLWLALNGQLAVRANYLEYRQVHILIQIYLFLGLFVLGFIAQAGPKIVGSSRPAHHLSLLWIPFSVFGVVAWILFPQTIVGPCVLSGVFISAVVYSYRYRGDADPNLRATAGNLILFGLLVFSISPFIDLHIGANAVLFFWGAMGALLIGSGQQFIQAFLSGRRCTPLEARMLLSLVIIVAGLLLVGRMSPYLWIWNTAGLGVIITVVYYIQCTRLWRAYLTASSDGLAVAFLAGYIWAIIGGALLLVYGSEFSDRVFHIWSIGWATPLILAVSGQIIGFTTGRNITKTKAFVVAIVCWQLVPIGRSLGYLLKLSPAFSWLVSIAASAVLLYWCFQLIRGEFMILRRNYTASSPKKG